MTNFDEEPWPQTSDLVPRNQKRMSLETVLHRTNRILCSATSKISPYPFLQILDGCVETCVRQCFSVFFKPVYYVTVFLL